MSIILVAVLFSGCQTTEEPVERVSVRPTPTIKLHNNAAQFTPIVRVKPKYPVKAAKAKQDGWVYLRFDIDESGDVENIKIVDASPKGFKFELYAKRAVRKWKYKPVIVDSINTYQSDQDVILNFNVN